MNVVVVHKEQSREEGHLVEQLVQELEAEHHDVLAVVSVEQPIEPLPDGCELVVAVGGDGTVGGVIGRVRGTHARLGIVPFGTANNIANTLGVRGSIRDLVRSYRDPRVVPFDIGVVRGPFGVRTFVESVGTGLVDRGIVTMDAEAPHAEQGDVPAMLKKARARYGELLATLPTQHLLLRTAGKVIEDDFVLVEVLNIRTIGPGLRLTGKVDSGDGWFDVVAVRAAEREQLAAVIAAEPRADAFTPAWTRLQVAEIELMGCDSVHIDDRAGIQVGNGALTLSVRPGAVDVLAPR